MRKVLAAALLCLFSTGVRADGPFRWTGLYIGGHAGWASGDWGVDLSHSSGAIHYNDPFDPATGSLDGADGWLGGFQAGYNHRFGNGLVVGLESDVSWTGIEAEGRFTTEAPNYATWDIKSKLDLFGSVRTRVGIANGPVLIYGTGGLAWGITDTSQATNWFPPAPPDVGGRTSGETAHIGWAAGGGGEWAITSTVSLKAEYLYVDLGSANYALKGTTKPDGSTPYVETFSSDLEFHVIRGGLNVKLN